MKSVQGNEFEPDAVLGIFPYVPESWLRMNIRTYMDEILVEQIAKVVQQLRGCSGFLGNIFSTS